MDFAEIKTVFKELFPAEAIFSSVKSKKGLGKILKDKFNMVEAEPINIGYSYKWKKIKFGIYHNIFHKYCNNIKSD